ncbi:MAG: hypothetical protein WCO35_03020 [Candidatus Nomurabacteria bacterium]
MKKNLKSIATGIILISSITIVLAGAQNIPEKHNKGMMRGNNPEKPGNMMRQGQENNKDNKPLVGIITSITGNILTVSETKMMPELKHSTSTISSTTKIYTVDASTSIIIKNGSTTNLSNISINDRVMINGLILGNNISAKIIRDETGQQNWNKNDGKRENNDWSTSTASTTKPQEAEHANFFSRIGGFLKNLFGRK